MKLQPIVLNGARVQLMPLQMGHAEALLEIAQAPEIWPYLPQRIENRQQTQRWIEAALVAQQAGAELPFVIFDHETNQIVGSTRLTDYSEAHRQVEIGWTWLSPIVWRTRVNSECKWLLLRHCFETLNLVRVQLKTDARNERSQRAIERLGAQKEGVLRSHRILSDGFIRDTVMYSILDAEWPNVKARLEMFLN